MGFEWGPLKGNCSSFVPRCDGTTNINTFTRLPGGTLTAGGKNVSVTNGIIVPVELGHRDLQGRQGNDRHRAGLDSRGRLHPHPPRLSRLARVEMTAPSCNAPRI